MGILFLPRTRSSRQMPGLKANPKRRHAWGRLDPSDPSVVLCVSVATFLCGPRLPQRHRDHRAICWEYFSCRVPDRLGKCLVSGKSKKTSRLGMFRPKSSLCVLCVSVATFLCGPRLPQRHRDHRAICWEYFSCRVPDRLGKCLVSRQIQKDVTPGDVQTQVIPLCSLCLCGHIPLRPSFATEAQRSQSYLLGILFLPRTRSSRQMPGLKANPKRRHAWGRSDPSDPSVFSVSLWPHSSAALVCHRGTEITELFVGNTFPAAYPIVSANAWSQANPKRRHAWGRSDPSHPSVFSVSLWPHSSAALVCHRGTEITELFVGNTFPAAYPIVSANAWSQGKSKKTARLGTFRPKSSLCVLCVSVATFLCGPRLPQRHRDHRAICWEYFSCRVPDRLGKCLVSRQIQKDVTPGDVQTQVIPLCSLCLCGHIPLRPSVALWQQP